MIQRYTPWHTNGEMIKDANGTWIQWEDVEELLDKLRTFESREAEIEVLLHTPLWELLNKLKGAP